MKPNTLFSIVFTLLMYVAATPGVEAVVPPPDGGYPGFNTAEGANALQNLTTGAANTGLGWRSLFLDTTGSFNTGVGAGALVLNTGDNNTAIGAGSLLLNTTGVANTATGAFALFSSTTGNFNTATGFAALHDNTTGSGLAGYGANALQHNTTGSFNTAVGGNGLLSNTTGGNNTATGTDALFSNTTGNDNTAIGASALSSNTNGDENTAIGSGALTSNTNGTLDTAVGKNALQVNTGDSNTAVGEGALVANTSGSANTAIGLGALFENTTGSDNIGLGANTGLHVVTASHVICIGNNVAGADVDNTTWIGNVYGGTTQNGTTAPVVVSADGQLGTVASSERFKKDIASMEKASEGILALRPVTFHYKTDTKGVPQFGLIAEEVAKVNSALVLSDKEGKPYTVRYDAVNAMLLNEFLKEHRKVAEQEAMIAQLKADLRATATNQQKQIEALTVSLQKVTAQLATASPSDGGLESNKPALQTALNSQ